MSEAGPSAVKRENVAMQDPEELREEDLFRMLEESDFSDCDDVDIKESLLFKEESSSDEEDPSLDVADDVWSNTFTPMKDIEFRKTPGLLIDVPEDASPYQYFRLLLDDDLLQLITTETNRYAENLFFSNISLEHARVTHRRRIKESEARCECDWRRGVLDFGASASSCSTT
ncbi:hypothetical protein Zmor_005493 [Zophobas morio]|uniref:PiggyBac transposable element-derived protein domain-containing protein n=1 Tax=Zophobas morio TaxID=2755281 RepID=A0AA38MM96_9CUCU|nr:hypothetical protein Zmor_005493 [Zophobas morio]